MLLALLFTYIKNAILMCYLFKYRSRLIHISEFILQQVIIENIFSFQIRKIMSKIQREQLSEESQQQLLQPVSKLFPPNQIITKSYSPDEKPILKLIKHQKPELGTCLELKNKYKSIFDSDDTLGYHHSYSLSNDVVYLKFNNQNYFKCKIKNHNYKFLAGLFIPYEQMFTSEVKNSRNIYRTLPNIEYVQYKNSIQDSFYKNNKITNTKTVKFSSNYQSGNLFIAMKKKQFQYDLILQNDINSKGNTQWFNFAVQFNFQGTYKFNILNFTKHYSQYEDGMKIVIYSYKDVQMGIKNGWTRGGENIKYQQSSVKRQDSDYKYYSQLSFQYTCNYPSDKVVFTYFYPYTSFDLQRFIKKTLYRKLNVHMKMQKIKICETISGLPVYAILIQHKKSLNLCNKLDSPNSINSNPPKLNKSVVFMARQHSGESQGSFVVEGIIDLLMQNGQIDHLKKNIDFVIFPMVNVDGVLYGNYRTNITGTDLNRVWRTPNKQLHPQVYHIKKYLQQLNKNSPISLIVDLHGHSKSLNSFFYGNPPKKDIITGIVQDPRLFPYVCSKKIKQVSFLQSTFFISEDKKNSARVVLSQYFPRAHVYTLQHSFQGYKKQNSNTIVEYTPQGLRKIGKQLVLTYLEFDKLCQKNPQIKQKWIKQISDLKQKLGVSHTETQGGDSDSQADFELMDLELPLKNLVSLQQNIKQKSIFGPSIQFQNIINKSQKQNFIRRNIIIKTHLQQRSYNKYNRKIINSDSLQIHKAKRESKEIKVEPKNTGSGFLSIVKIRTPNQMDQTLPNNSSMMKTEQKRKAAEQFFNKENILQKLHKKKMKIQQAVISSEGMKAFLKTMGIPLERKFY